MLDKSLCVAIVLVTAVHQSGALAQQPATQHTEAIHASFSGLLEDTLQTGGNGIQGTCSPHGCPASCCPSAACHDACREVCCPHIEQVTEEESCWQVECEKVCVPAVNFPWEPGGSKLTLFSWLERYRRGPQRNCELGGGNMCDSGAIGCACPPARCGRVRCVRVLEKQEYEVTTNKCEWEIRRVPPCVTNSAP